MTEQSFSISAESFSFDNLWLAMGYRGASPEQYIRAAAEEAVSELVPKALMRSMYGIVPASKLSPGRIMLGGVGFRPGGIIASYLDGMESACVFVATAGKEFNEAVKEVNSHGDVFTDFIADSIGTVLAELAVEKIEKEFIGEDASLSYSPGYCGWDIREQQKFFSLFPPEPCGVSLSESSIMTPEKSISGFAAFGRTLTRQPYHCEICKNSHCYKRRNTSHVQRSGKRCPGT